MGIRRVVEFLLRHIVLLVVLLILLVGVIYRVEIFQLESTATPYEAEPAPADSAQPQEPDTVAIPVADPAEIPTEAATDTSPPTDTPDMTGGGVTPPPGTESERAQAQVVAPNTPADSSDMDASDGVADESPALRQAVEATAGGTPEQPKVVDQGGQSTDDTAYPADTMASEQESAEPALVATFADEPETTKLSSAPVPAAIAVEHSLEQVNGDEIDSSESDDPLPAVSAAQPVVTEPSVEPAPTAITPESLAQPPNTDLMNPQLVVGAAQAEEGVTQPVTSQAVEQYLGAARSAYWQGAIAEAETIYQELIALDPSNIDGHGELANLYLSQGRFNLAQGEFNEACRLMIGNGERQRAWELISRLGRASPQLAEVLRITWFQP